MGVEASQARVRHYLESRTIGNKDVIDPTGTLREIHGSQHTVLKDWSFGLGLKPRDDVISKVAAKYPDVTPIESLLPKMQAAAGTKENKTSAEAEMLAARSAAAELHPSMNLAPFQETASVPEFAGLWAEEGKGAAEGGRKLKLSKLELKMMEEARMKQKENIVQPQVTLYMMIIMMKNGDLDTVLQKHFAQLLFRSCGDVCSKVLRSSAIHLASKSKILMLDKATLVRSC